MAGPQGTPYSQGLWKLHLRIPEDYPKSPPKAAFRTRIWHPNVEENTGSVCVDTLKRDWDSKLTLRDILIVGSWLFFLFTHLWLALIRNLYQTISCLLIQPNPDSALNSTAGHLLQDDYDSFARQAKLMTSIHARIPTDLSEAVLVAQRRGETVGAPIIDHVEQQPPKTTELCKSSGLIVRNAPYVTIPSNDNYRNPETLHPNQLVEHDDCSDIDTDDEASASKENDPSQSPSPVTPPTPRKSTSIKRPLSDLPTPTESQTDEENPLGITSSGRNIANNMAYFTPPFAIGTENSSKALKLAERTRSVNFASRGLQDVGVDGLVIVPYDIDAGEANDVPAAKRLCSGGGKENVTEGLGIERTAAVMARSVGVGGNVGLVKQACNSSRKPALASMAGSKGVRPRIGLRRL